MIPWYKRGLRGIPSGVIAPAMLAGAIVVVGLEGLVQVVPGGGRSSSEVTQSVLPPLVSPSCAVHQVEKSPLAIGSFDSPNNRVWIVVSLPNDEAADDAGWLEKDDLLYACMVVADLGEFQLVHRPSR